jgi:hypothetical protein
MTNMTKARLRSRTGFPTLAAALALTALALWSPPSRADILGTCDAYDSLITCAATDVGKACQGGGRCFEMPCAATPGASTTKVYRCLACPTLIAAPSGTCTMSNFGATCGDGDGGTGTCAVIGSSCQGASGKFACQTPATAQPTGPPAGSIDGSSDASGTGGTSGASSGCDVVPRPPKPTSIGLGLIALGVVVFAIDRIRRRSR